MERPTIPPVMLPRASTANIAADRIMNAPSTSKRNPSHLQFQQLSISSLNKTYNKTVLST